MRKSEFQINTYTASHQLGPSVTGLSDGGFVVTWDSYGQDGDGVGIYGQRYDSSGSTTGPEFQINTYTTDDQYDSSVTSLSDGGFVVTWGFVAQIGLRPISPLPRTDLAYGHGTGYAKSCETVEDSGADLDLCDLTIEVARREALAKSFYTMHLRFDTAPAVIPGQISPQSAT